MVSRIRRAVRHGVPFVPLQPQQLGAEKPGIARQPTMSAKSAKQRCSSAHSADARPSFHNKAGRMGVSEPSSKVTPSIWPDRPIRARPPSLPALRPPRRRGCRRPPATNPAALVPTTAAAGAKGQRCAGRRYWTVVVVDDDGLDARRADVDAKRISTGRCRAGCRARHAAASSTTSTEHSLARSTPPGSPSCSSRLKPRWTWRCRAASRAARRSRAG